MKKGGSVVQKTIELLVKQSASIVSLPDEGYSTASPSLVMSSLHLKVLLSILHQISVSETLIRFVQRKNREYEWKRSFHWKYLTVNATFCSI